MTIISKYMTFSFAGLLWFRMCSLCFLESVENAMVKRYLVVQDLYSESLCHGQNLMVARNMLEALLMDRLPSIGSTCGEETDSHTFNDDLLDDYNTFLDGVDKYGNCDWVWLISRGHDRFIPSVEEVIHYTDLKVFLPVVPVPECLALRELDARLLVVRSLDEVLVEVFKTHGVLASNFGIELLFDNFDESRFPKILENTLVRIVFANVDLQSVLLHSRGSPDFFIFSKYVDCRPILQKMLLFHSAIKVLVLYMAEGMLDSVIELVGSLYTLVSVSGEGESVFVRSQIFSENKKLPIHLWMGGFKCNPIRTHIVSFSYEGLAHFGSPLLEESRAMRLVESKGRAHCFEGFCDCLFPFTGFLCIKKSSDVVDEVIYYLVSNSTIELTHLEYSLANLFALETGLPPIVIFYDSKIDYSRFQNLFGRSIWFVNQFFKDHPRPSPDVYWHYRPIGYRQVCRFESGPVFWHPAMKKFETIYRLDSDGYFPSSVESLFGTIRKKKFPVDLAYAGPLISVPLNRVSVLPGWLAVLGQSSSQHIVSVNNPPYVFRKKKFISPAWREFFGYIDALGGFYTHGLLGNAVLTQGVLLLNGTMEQIDNLAWAHTNHCECPQAFCLWSHTHWKCVDQLRPECRQPYFTGFICIE